MRRIPIFWPMIWLITLGAGICFGIGTRTFKGCP